MNSSPVKKWFGITEHEWSILFERRPNPEGRTKLILWVVTALLTPITLTGSLLGYVRGFRRFMAPHGEAPSLYPLRPIVRAAMILGAIMIWLVLLGVLWLVVALLPRDLIRSGAPLYYVLINLALGWVVFLFFRRWREQANSLLAERQKFGTARFARAEELQDYYADHGLWIGGGHTFGDKGHVLTVAGTRGGKGTSLIIPCLLGIGKFEGSWVVIDPKGENAAITARYQRERGQSVLILNPWGLLSDKVGESSCYNPLDILNDTANINLVDDAQMIAEMIVPIDKNEREKFFTDNARTIVAGLLLHLVTYEDDAGNPIKDRTLNTLWQWVRLPENDWKKLLEDMHVNDHAQFGKVVTQIAHEIEKLMAAGERTWGSIIATVLQCTDFIKSPALQAAMESGFDPKTLSDGETTMYVIIPADKLQSHARWLRLVVTTTMRAVVRNPNKKVCFLLDEFAALGYLPEIETALSTYAGYNVTVWSILQSLIQLKANYKDNWETFVGNSTIRQFFSVNDNFTAEYVSKAIGTTSNVIMKGSGQGEEAQANQRYLVTPDEVRRGSGDYMFTFMGAKPVTAYPKVPYYFMYTLIDDGKPRYDENPYFK